MTDEQMHERALQHLRTASRVLYLLALLKAFGALIGLKLLTGPAVPPEAGGWFVQVLREHPQAAPAAIIVWYVTMTALAIALGRAIGARNETAAKLGFWFALVQIAGIALITTIPLVALMNVVLGVVLFTTLLLASSFGAFDEPAVISDAK
ncbi:MAG: hypothetical protein WBX15_10465 [Thermoanaerobaculia bacterium]